MRKVPTHGSLTKAGKVRAQTPKIETTNNSKSVSPKLAVRKMYNNRILHPPDTRWSRGRRRSY